MLYLRFIDKIFMVCKKSQNELKIFMKDLNKNHLSKRYLHVISRQPYPFQKNTPYSQTVQLKCIFSTFEEYVKHSRAHLGKFVDKESEKKIYQKPN